MRRTTTAAGTLPCGSRDAQVAAEGARGLLDAALDLLRGTSASTRTRDSGSSVTVVFIAWQAIPPRADLALHRPRGHLAAGVADWAELLARYGWARVRRRDPWAQPHADG
jgi:hypothetical protein